MVHELHDTNREARPNFVNWYLHAVHEAINPTSVLFSEESWVYISGYVTLIVTVTFYRKAPINTCNTIGLHTPLSFACDLLCARWADFFLDTANSR
jgi:hypothetical protein